MVSGHHIRLIQVSNFLDLNIYEKTPWGPRVIGESGVLKYHFKEQHSFENSCNSGKGMRNHWVCYTASLEIELGHLNNFDNKCPESMYGRS